MPSLEEKKKHFAISYRAGEDMEQYIHDSDSEIRRLCAEFGIGLDELVYDDEDDIKIIIAQYNDSDLLEILKNDDSPDVRAEVARQGYDLYDLMQDPDDTVREIAVQQSSDVTYRMPVRRVAVDDISMNAVLTVATTNKDKMLLSHIEDIKQESGKYKLLREEDRIKAVKKFLPMLSETFIKLAAQDSMRVKTALLESICRICSRGAQTQNPQIYQDIMNQLVKANKYLQLTFLESADKKTFQMLSEENKHNMLYHSGSQVKIALINNIDKLPPEYKAEVEAHCIQSHDMYILKALALQGEHLSRPTLEKLTESPLNIQNIKIGSQYKEYNVTHFILLHSKDKDVALKAAKDFFRRYYSDFTLDRKAVAKAMAQHPLPEVRIYFLKHLIWTNLTLKPELQHAFAHDSDAEVKKAFIEFMTHNKKVNIDVMKEMCKDSNPEIRRMVAGHFGYDQAIFEALKDDKNWSVRRDLYLSSGVVENQYSIIDDPDDRVKSLLASHISYLDYELKEKVLTNNNPDIRKEAYDKMFFKIQIPTPKSKQTPVQSVVKQMLRFERKAEYKGTQEQMDQDIDLSMKYLTKSYKPEVVHDYKQALDAYRSITEEDVRAYFDSIVSEDTPDRDKVINDKVEVYFDTSSLKMTSKEYSDHVKDVVNITMSKIEETEAEIQTDFEEDMETADIETADIDVLSDDDTVL